MYKSLKRQSDTLKIWLDEFDYSGIHGSSLSLSLAKTLTTTFTRMGNVLLG